MVENEYISKCIAPLGGVFLICCGTVFWVFFCVVFLIKCESLTPEGIFMEIVHSMGRTQGFVVIGGLGQSQTEPSPAPQDGREPPPDQPVFF